MYVVLYYSYSRSESDKRQRSGRYTQIGKRGSAAGIQHDLRLLRWKHNVVLGSLMRVQYLKWAYSPKCKFNPILKWCTHPSRIIFFILIYHQLNLVLYSEYEDTVKIVA